jgi:transposase
MVKSEVPMPARTRRRYTEEFKREAVRLVRESAHPVAQVARDLGISDNVLYRWTAQHRQAAAHGTTRVAQRAEAEELTRVKRELARVTQERDFLKRAAAFFARESQ